MFAADRAGRVALERDLPELHAQGVVGEKTVGQQVTLGQQELDRLGGLDGAQDAGQHADHPGLGTGGDGVLGRRLGKDAAVAGRFPRPDGHGLAVELQDAAMGVGVAGQYAGVVDQELGGEVVGAVDDKVVVGDDVHRCWRREIHSL